MIELLELTTGVETPSKALPGATAPGLGSAAQLVEMTAFAALQTDATTAPGWLRLAMPASAPAIIPRVTPLTAAEFPVLNEVWDNEADEVFDRL